MAIAKEFVVFLAEPRGFCAGVDRAILIVEKALELYGKPIYVKHEIVHNKHVVERLKLLGAIFTEDLSAVPRGARLIFSAHGVSPAVKKAAMERELIIFDATCPLVTKVHKEAVRHALDGYQIVLIGHPEHVEVIGTYGYAPLHITIVSTLSDVENLQLNPFHKSVYLTQTTLSVDDTQEIIAALLKKYPQMEPPLKEDICYATTNRQNAVKAMAKAVEIMLVVGSDSSSNTMRLLETSARLTKHAYLVQDETEVQAEWFEGVHKVGLTAGASAPEELLQAVLKRILFFRPGRAESFQYTRENISFTLPYLIRKKLAEVGQ